MRMTQLSHNLSLDTNLCLQMSSLSVALRRSKKLLGTVQHFHHVEPGLSAGFVTAASTQPTKAVPQLVKEVTKPSANYSEEKMNLIISGYPECGFFKKAQRVGHAYEKKFPDQVTVSVVSREYDKFHQYRVAVLEALNFPEDKHKSCPLVYKYKLNDNSVVPFEFVGGCDNTIALLKKLYGDLPETAGPLWR